MSYILNDYIEIFVDTTRKSKKFINTGIEEAQYYDIDMMNQLAEQHVDVAGNVLIKVSGDDSYRAARKMKKQNGAKEILVLNFANSISQGGGVRIGARAQEEDLCRTSTLYSSLMSEGAFPFYDFNRIHDLNVKGSDTAIYSPHVFIFKDEDYHDIVPVEVSVVTMAAPINEPEINAVEILDQRIYKLLCLAESLEHKNLILGAWGCGAFGNDPYDVAKLFQKNLKKFKSFEQVVFAVCKIVGRDGRNYEAFREILE